MPDIELTPVPLDLMLRHAVDDGGDYDDGIGGYVSGLFDEDSGVLTLRYERAEGEETNPEDDDYNHCDTHYRFQLIPDGAETPETAADLVSQAITYINYLREEGEGDLRSIRDWLSQPRETRLADIAEIEADE